MDAGKYVARSTCTKVSVGSPVFTFKLPNIFRMRISEIEIPEESTFSNLISVPIQLNSVLRATAVPKAALLESNRVLKQKVY